MPRRTIGVHRSPKDLSEWALDEIAQQEDTHYKATKERLPDEVALVQRLRTLYDAKIKEVPEVSITPILLFHDSGRSLVMATLTLMRVHLSDALSITRRAIESAAYAHITRDPKNAAVWRNKRSGDPEFWKVFQQKRFRKEVPESAELEARWKVACEGGSHATLASIGGRLKFRDHQRFSTGYFDVSDDPEVDVRRTFNWIISTHRLILSAFARVIGEYLPTNWDADLKSVDEAHVQHIKRVVAPLLQGAHKNPAEILERTPGGIYIPRQGDIASMTIQTLKPSNSRRR